ncbi:MAG: SMI1/KNR4 family protein [Actinomycetia bacterium]|nr:SMI1/KNR4 family protein [Actinomycetes bacterium]
MSEDLEFPPDLAELLDRDFPYEEDGDIDFEPYQRFQSLEDNADWIRSWTGNSELDGAEYRFFGQDGTGGMVGFWLVRPGQPVLEQPVVFFGSEGTTAVIARDFADLCWLMAGGSGPMEAAEGLLPVRPDPEIKELAEEVAPDRKAKPKHIVAAARAEFPSFASDIEALTR